MVNKNKFGFHSTNEEVLNGIDLTGKTVLITGGSDGLGKETARALASKGAEVTIAARNSQKMKSAADELTDLTGKKIDTGIVELDKPESIRSFATNWLLNHKKLDILINNAGIGGRPLSRTKEGFELQFATNHLGHFLLTNLLLPALKASGNARVVNLSSRGHRGATVNLEDVNFEHRDYDQTQAYSQSKTAVLWFSNEFNRRYQSENIHSFAIHPGAIKTQLNKNMPKDQVDAVVKAYESLNLIQTVEQGTATCCWAATSKELDGKGGLYLCNCNISGLAKDVKDPVDPGYASHAFDEEGEKSLWELSNKLLHTDF